MKIFIRWLSLALTVMLLTSVLAASPAKAELVPLDWKWFDGPAVKTKTISWKKYNSYYRDYISIDIQLPDDGVVRRAVLEYQYKGKWYEEVAAENEPQYAERKSKISLYVTAVDDNEDWISGTWTYRIRVLPMEGQPNFTVPKFKVKFVPSPWLRAKPSGGSGSGGSSSSVPNVVGYRLDTAINALQSRGFNPSYADGCGSMFGIINKDNWRVVRQIGTMLYACKTG
jgi:hypothetical protein